MSRRWWTATAAVVVAAVLGVLAGLSIWFLPGQPHLSRLEPAIVLNGHSDRSEAGGDPETSTGFVAESIQAPHYKKAMASIARSEAQGVLPNPPAADAPAEEVRSFGQRWQETWGPSFQVTVVKGRPPLQPGSPAPPWSVTDVEGHPVRLEEFRGRFLLIMWGSLSCLTTCYRIPAFEELAGRFAGLGLASVFVYQREAHPGKQFGFGVIHQAFSPEDRIEHAKQLASMFGLSQLVVFDDMENRTKQAYGAQENSAYLIDVDGRIICSQVFFDPEQMDQELAKRIESP